MKKLKKLVSTERKMLRMMSGVTLRDKISSSGVAEREGVGSIEEWLRRQHLRWFEHVLRRGEDTEVGRVIDNRSGRAAERGRPARR